MSAVPGRPLSILLEEGANNFDAVATLTGVDERTSSPPCWILLESKEHYQSQSRTSSVVIGDHGYDIVTQNASL